jgi:hypothetical protein
MRFHLDEHVSDAIADGLKRHGIDVTSTNDVGLRGAPDRHHVEFALRERRVIFTNDRDFPRIAASGIAHSGIVYAAPQRRSVGQIIEFLLLMHHCMKVDEVAGTVVYA